MLIVTGGIACGKSTFLEVSRELCDGVIIDADEWYHNERLQSEAHKRLAKTLFNNVSVKAAAFTHLNWSIFEKAVVDAFCEYTNNVKPVICVIPEFFKREDYFRARLNVEKVLTIERKDSMAAAFIRDTHRTEAQTKRIAENQSTTETRVELSDYVLYNAGSKDDFKQECVLWLKSHLLEVSTRPTKAIGT